MQSLPPYRIEISFSDEDREHVATCTEIPGLSGLGETPNEAIEELKQAILGWLKHLEDKGLPLPEPAVSVRWLSLGDKDETSPPTQSMGSIKTLTDEGSPSADATTR